MDNEFGKKLHNIRKSKNLTLEAVGNYVGVQKSTVQKWEKGIIHNMKVDKITKLAKILSISPDYILGYQNNQNNRSSGIKINVLGEVAAGIPIDAVENIIDTEEISEKLSITGNFFGLKIKGDSMNPRICDGDVVIVKQLSTCYSGDIVIVRINNESATCKKLIKHNKGISLVSFNTNYAPMFFTNEEIKKLPIEIIGKVVELRGKF
ncbi:MAG: S24 family peptidase [Eubacteriales bacterium]|nr:S24 family peptidase [Eubacteriales bacterium]